jgi:hypothetical protein
MPFNLLLFPLVGGYYFITNSRYWRFHHQRIENQRLLLNSVIAGAFLLLISFGTAAVLFMLAPTIAKSITDYSPLPIPYFWTTIGSFIYGIVITHATNRFMIGRDEAIRRCIQDTGNELERLMETSFSKPQLIQLTLKNDKVYVGMVQSLPIPQHSNYVSLWPAFSGYRTKETKELRLTTTYLDVYAEYVQAGKATDVKTIARIVVKIDEILTANTFDMEMYDKFNQPVPQTPN